MSIENNDVFYDVILLKNIKTKEEAIKYMSNYLLEKDCVTSEHEEATINREHIYPTGLPTSPIGIAVPHSEAENVKKKAVILGITDNLIQFNEMGNNESIIDVGIIFLLALKGENNHINYLKNIVSYCRVDENVSKLYNVKNAEEAYKILTSEIL